MNSYFTTSHIRFRIDRGERTTANIKQIIVPAKPHGKREIHSVLSIVFVNRRQAADNLDDFLFTRELYKKREILLRVLEETYGIALSSSEQSPGCGQSGRPLVHHNTARHINSQGPYPAGTRGRNASPITSGQQIVSC